MTCMMTISKRCLASGFNPLALEKEVYIMSTIAIICLASICAYNFVYSVDSKKPARAIASTVALLSLIAII